jgi:MoxR-like ATPase
LEHELPALPQARILVFLYLSEFNSEIVRAKESNSFANTSVILRSAMFSNLAEVKTALAQQQYIATDEIATVIFLADKLQKPVLVEGPAGVGKTELAKAWAGATKRPLIRLQCYEGLDETKALYEWEYAKQMLYTQLLRDQLRATLADAKTLGEAADKLATEEDVFFSERFLLQRPLLKAIRAEEPSLLLVDEIDRSDSEFEAFLLEVLSDFQVSVPEVGTLKAKHMPLVILTSNNTRELSEALKRRCLYLFIDYPSVESELKIVRLKVPDLAPQMAKQAVELVHRLRGLELKKYPSVSETLDWARALLLLNAPALDEKTLQDTMTVLLKHEHDVQRARRLMSEFGTRAEDDASDDLDDLFRQLPRPRKPKP